MSRNFHYRDRNIFLKLYTQYVRPHVEFATPAWSPWLLSDIKTIEKVQEKAVGMISGLKGKDYEEKCKELKIETLQERRRINDMTQVYKLAADPLNIRPDYARTDTRMNFFSQRITTDWNKIPNEIKTSNSVNVFKEKYRRFAKTQE
jgi:hypothetical protein